MKQDEIIEMARQSSVELYGLGKKREVFIYRLEAFAKLVAAKERKACAEMCKKHADVYGAFEPTPSSQAAWAACIDIRDQIRARGEA